MLGCRQPARPGRSSCILACLASYWYNTLNQSVTHTHSTPPVPLHVFPWCGCMQLKCKQVASVIYDVSLNTTNLLAARRDTTTRATVSAVRFQPRLLRGGQYVGIAIVPKKCRDITTWGGGQDVCVLPSTLGIGTGAQILTFEKPINSTTYIFGKARIQIIRVTSTPFLVQVFISCTCECLTHIQQEYGYIQCMYDYITCM